MVTWATIGFQMGFRSIERAYHESRKTFEGEIETIDVRMEEYQASLGADIDEDDDRNYTDHLADLAWEAEQALKTIREAFVMTIYHFWENQCRNDLGGKEFKDWIANAQGRPDYRMDEAGLNQVRMIVNCIKHGDKKKHHGTTLADRAPYLFDKDLVAAATEEADLRIALRLRDEDVLAAFGAVKASGPRSDYSGEQPKEIVL